MSGSNNQIFLTKMLRFFRRNFGTRDLHQKNTKKAFSNRSLATSEVHLKNVVPILLSYTMFKKTDNNKSDRDLKTLEDEVIEGIHGGEAEIIELINVLEECILEACNQYRDCLKKQIEITQVAMELGPFCDALDDLTEYRALANDLNQELNNYITLLRTIGEMTYDHFNSAIRNGEVKQIECISQKYKHLEVILERQLDENKKCETELLCVNRNLILKTKT